MPQPDIDAIDRFSERHAPALEKIVRFSRGLTSLCELRSDAWLATSELSDALGRSMDFDAAVGAEKLLQQLRQSTDKQIRESRRLYSCDTPIAGEDSPSLLSTFVSDDGAHPLSLLMALEDETASVPQANAADAYHSESAAWHWLAIRFNHRMCNIAARLMISTSWCRQRGDVRVVGCGNNGLCRMPWRLARMSARCIHGGGSNCLIDYHLPRRN